MEDISACAGWLAQFAAQVRESTARRFQSVRPEDRGWSARPDLLRFVDVLQHLVDADLWLFGWLDGRGSSSGVVIAPGDADPSAWDALLIDFYRHGQERSHRLASLTEREFSERQFDLGHRGVVSLSQLILRCTIDHEIHHRGAVHLGLRLRYG